MKLFFRRPWVQAALAWLLSAYIGLTLATMRWRYENRASAEALLEGPDGIVACFWHGRIGLAAICRGMLKQKQCRALISNSPDGELVARIVERLGFPSIRGSSTSDRRAPRRSVQAFREALRFLGDGGVVVITPDGPRGPPQEMPDGPLMLAKVRQTPVLLYGLAARPALTLKSWDKSKIPLPFGRGCVVFDAAGTVPRDADPGLIETTRLDWQARLTAAQDRAEALLAG